ncbi:beta-ketoacyl-[acyl-carrier-protein] synthase family protein [Polycladospora coralii]
MVNKQTSPICITGMAWHTALGSDLNEVWQKLLKGESGCKPVSSPFPLRNMRAGTIDFFSLDQQHRTRQHDLACTTIERVLEHAQLESESSAIRYILGTSYGSHLDEPVDSLHTWAVEVGESLRTYHKPLSLTTACSSASDSILVGASLIESGESEICVCGGADIVTISKRLAHSALNTMSPTYLRAFDESHDGMLLGEGAGFLVLESQVSAERRNATIYGYLLGAGASNDASGMTSPDPSGESIQLAIKRAFQDSETSIEELAIINAHGSGTPVNDAVEQACFHLLFGEQSELPLVFATKGGFGHSLGATGALEAITVLLALNEKQIPPIFGLENPMHNFTLPLPINKPSSFTGSVGASLTLGFGGFNTCLLFQGKT